MPNIDSFISGEIQAKTNKTSTSITSAPAATWTDTQYPSASQLYNMQSTIKTRLDNLHPVGSTLCMSSNINPSIYYGGTWQLIDKSFAPTAISITEDDWIPTNSTLYTGSYFYNQNKIYLYDKVMTVSLSLYPNSTMTGDGTYSLGKLNFISFDLYPVAYYSYISACAHGDGSQARIIYTFYNTGAIEVYDSLYAGGSGTHQADRDTIVFDARFTFTPMQMPDKYCNKFIFKRTS